MWNSLIRLFLQKCLDEVLFSDQHEISCKPLSICRKTLPFGKTPWGIPFTSSKQCLPLAGIPIISGDIIAIQEQARKHSEPFTQCHITCELTDFFLCGFRPDQQIFLGTDRSKRYGNNITLQVKELVMSAGLTFLQISSPPLLFLLLCSFSFLLFHSLAPSILPFVLIYLFLLLFHVHFFFLHLIFS